jgi:transcriptional regulator with PAS, ATPase and Fis domain
MLIINTITNTQYVYLNLLVINIDNQRWVGQVIDKKTEDMVIEFITTAKEPVHSSDLARALNINRITITKYLSVLHSKGLVSFRKIGMAKVWSPIESPVLQTFKANDPSNTTIQAFNSLGDGVCILDKEMHILWVNKEMEKRHGKLKTVKGKNCFDVFHDEIEICKNCPTKKTIETGKKCSASIKKSDHVLEISTSPIKDQRGRLTAIIEIVRITKKGKN